MDLATHQWNISYLIVCRVFDAMEPMSKGIHRALIPIDSQYHHTSGVELTEASPGYHIFTQTDMVQFLYNHAKELDMMTNMSVGELGAVHTSVFAAPSWMKVMDVVKCMRNASLQAVAIVESTMETDEDSMLLIVSVFSTSLCLCQFILSYYFTI